MRLGVQAALDEVGAAGPEGPERGEERGGPAQLALIPEAVGEGERRGPGRPQGARNKSTEEMRRWLIEARGLKSPLEWLLELVCKPVDEVVRMGIEHSQVAKLQVAAAVAVLPYLHSRMPISIQSEGVAPIPLVLNLGAGEAEEIGLRLLPKESKEYQQVIDADIDQSDEERSEE